MVFRTTSPLLLAALLATALGAGAVRAQTVDPDPVATPASAPQAHAVAKRASKVAKVKPAKVKPAKVASTKKEAQTPAEPWAAVDPGRATYPSSTPPQGDQSSSAGSPAQAENDPPEWGMKVHGADVSANQTRNQNFNGNETGIGGLLGMNFHF